MNRRTTFILVGILVVLGMGFYALGAIEQESQVRTVAEIQNDPDAHYAGSYIMVGFPEAQAYRVVNDEQEVQFVENTHYQNTTLHAESWQQDGTYLLSTITTTVESVGDGSHRWLLVNTTRDIDTDVVVHERNASWVTPATEIVFQVRAFEDADNANPIWATYDGILPEGVTPRPSQLTGSFRGDLDDDARVWGVEVYTVGCSSKFLPEDFEHETLDDEIVNDS